MLYKLKTSIRRWITSSLDLNRPANFPFISGDNFKSIADHTFDEVSDLNPSEVFSGDIVFVRGNHLDEFFATKHEQIANPYILIVHNDDAATSENHMKFLEGNKIIHLFACNLLFSHPKATAVPVGINSRRYDRKNIIINAVEEYSKNDAASRKSRVFYGFDIRTNYKVRVPILEILKSIPLAETTNQRVNKKTYQQITSTYKVIASPPGNGFDCLRTWESLYLHTVPIVEDSPAVESWKKIGIPLHVIKDWREISTLTEKDIDGIYADLSSRFDCEVLWMPYWVSMIQKVQADHRAKFLPSLFN